MNAIQENAELAVRRLLKDMYVRSSGQPLEAVEHMDDGTPIQLKITINGKDGSAEFDFTGTGPEVYGKTRPRPSLNRISSMQTIQNCG